MRLSAHLDTDTDTRLVCTCGCGMGTRLEHWRPELLELFEAVRAHLGQPVYIVSGWRCPRHNGLVAVSEHSQHAIGAALDCQCPKMNFADFADATEFTARTSSKGQAGVGTYPHHQFVHIDLGLGKNPGRRWTP